jgi:broad specificity phosphatase PhoE
MLDERTVFLVPTCDAGPEGELTVLGVRQSCLVGDALGDRPLRAVYAGPGQAATETAETIAQRHGLVVRRKPALVCDDNDPFDEAAQRIIAAFENISRAGPGRTSLIVTDHKTLQIIVAHCCNVAPRADEPRQVAPASVTEITVEETRYVIEQREQTDHLAPLQRPGR